MSDVLSIEAPSRTPDASWLLQSAVSLLHSPDESAPAHLAEVVRHLTSNPDEVMNEIVAVFDRTPRNVYPMRWSLLNVVGLLRYPPAAKWLAEVAIEPIPVVHKSDVDGCETPTDSEQLMRVMAVESIAELGEREPELVLDLLVEVIRQQPDTAVRAAAWMALGPLAPDARPAVADVLNGDQRFILEMKRIHFTELSADPDLDVMVSKNPNKHPKLDDDRTTPSGPCCNDRKG